MKKFILFLGAVGSVVTFFMVGSWYDDTYGFDGSASAAFAAALGVFILFTVIGFVLDALIDSKKSKTPPSTLKKENYKLIDFYSHFERVLNNTLRFVDAYLTELPGEFIFINVCPVFEKGEYSTDTYLYYEEFIEFEVKVGCWWDSILYKNKEAKEYMECIYNYDSSDDSFTYRMRIGDSTNCIIPQDVVRKKFFDCLDTYEKNNPNRKLTRTSYGIHHVWNL